MLNKILYIIMMTVGYILAISEVFFVHILQQLSLACGGTAYSEHLEYLGDWPLNVIFVANVVLAIAGTLLFVIEIKKEKKH